MILASETTLRGDVWDCTWNSNDPPGEFWLSTKMSCVIQAWVTTSVVSTTMSKTR